MLYNEQWDRKKPATEPDKFSLAGLVAWLERQSPETEYDFRNSSTCLLAQYLIAVAGQTYPGEFNYSKVCGGIAPYHTVASRGPWTYGAALKRARQVLAMEVA
jgi:hypothetical protein